MALFALKVDFGTLGQAQFAFSMDKPSDRRTRCQDDSLAGGSFEVLGSVTIIVSRIQEISRFSAGISRLGAFWEALAPNVRQLRIAMSPVLLVDGALDLGRSGSTQD